jgi:asparagine synthase (glutamine-hydrolysing)
MCGIAGILHFEPERPVDSQALTRMADAMRHRGPDAAGVWCSGPIGFAHRRLAIIDLEGGAQPAVSAETGLALTYNGEIFNFRELREELAMLGARFRDRSDTEVLLRAFERWGPASVDRLNGMFAFAVWDPRPRTLTLVRDRLGVKPLYYRQDARTITFASELNALAAEHRGSMVIDEDGLRRYLRLQYVPSPGTILQGVSQLQPGRVLTVSADGESRLDRYWRPTPSASGDGDAGACRDALMRSVRRQMVADVPVGAFLSGGVDSSLIVASMVASQSAPVETFSVGFDGGPRFDERSAARRVADHLRTTHHERLVTARDAVERLPDIVRRMDEPLADYAALPTFLVAELAASRVKVVLTGEGADELFGGYRRYRRELWRDWSGRGRRSYLPSHLFSEEEIDRLLGSDGSFQRVRLEAPADCHEGDRLNRLLVRDIEGWLPDDLLVKVDRMTMLCSLEARVPYLDHEFVEFALGIPGRQKLHPFKPGSKTILREAAKAAKLPPEVFARPKHGFTPPVDRWMKAGLLGTAREHLTDASASIAPRFDRHEVVRLLDGQARGRRYGHRIWALIVFELWCRRHGLS